MLLRPQALAALCLHDPAEKAGATRDLQALAQAGQVVLDPDAELAEPDALPGRPDRPRLVPVQQVPRRSPFSVAGRAALLHAVCHIEFNAINLALDAVWRFPGLPEAYYRDWLRVADEEALHFTLLREHLQSLGHDYGDFDAHDGLFDGTERGVTAARTDSECTARPAPVSPASWRSGSGGSSAPSG